MSAVLVADANLEAIAALGVAVPAYDRRRLAPRVLHVGVGGFHRSHMALYTDEAAAAGGDWGIRGIGLLPADRRMADALDAQDHLYTLIERDGDGSSARVVGSLLDFAFVAGDDAAFAALVADPEVAILSLTITEGGYSLAQPNPTIESIVTALDARRAAGGPPLTILSCDNLPGNGDVARGAITAVACGAGRRGRAIRRDRVHVPELDGRQDHAADARRGPGMAPRRGRRRRPLAGRCRAVPPVGGRGSFRRRPPAVGGRRRPLHRPRP